MVAAAMVLSVAVNAATEDSMKIHRLEVEAIPGVILHTNSFLEGNNTEVRTMNRSFVAKLKYAFLPPEGSLDAAIFKGVYQGVGLSLHSFNSQLGNPVSLYLFQGATIKTITPRLTLNYEWDFGLTYGWKSFDSKDNPENRVIGSKMTAYIDADIYLRYIVSRQWDLNLGATFTHYSNGNTTIPNAGLNVAGIKASAAYYFNRQQIKQTATTVPPADHYWYWDLTLWGAWKRKGIETQYGAYAAPYSFGVAGINLNPLYHLNHWFNVGASLDATYDKSANIEIDDEATQQDHWVGTDDNIHHPAWYRQVAFGISGRVEFTMPYFTINFGIGHNFVNAQTIDFKGFYEILALKIALVQKAYLHIGYSLYDFRYPNNLMLGIGVHL